MMNIELIQLFMNDYYKLPRQKSIRVVLTIAIVYFFMQLFVVNGYIFLRHDVSTLIILNILLVFILSGLTTLYFSYALLLSNEEYEKLIYLPISEQDIMRSKIISSMLLPLTFSLAPQWITVLFMIMKFEWMILLKYLLFIPLFVLLIILIHYVPMSILYLIRKYFKSHAHFLIVNSLVILCLWGGAIYSFVSFVNLKEIHFNVHGMSALQFVDELILFIHHVISSLPIMTSLLGNNEAVKYIILLLLLSFTNFFMFTVASYNIAKRYKINSQLDSKPLAINQKRMLFSKSDLLFYMQRENLIIQSYAYFRVQMLITVIMPIIIGFIVLLFKENIFNLLDISFLKANFFIVYSYVVFLMCIFNNQIGTVYSKEGKLYATQKYMPLNESLLNTAKVIYITIMNIISIVISFVVYFVMEGFTVNSILMLIFLIILCLLNNLLAPLFDKKKPMVDWEKASDAIKSNFNVVIGMVTSIPVVSLFLIIHAIGLMMNISQILLLPVLAVLAIVLVIFLRKKIYANT